MAQNFADGKASNPTRVFYHIAFVCSLLSLVFTVIAFSTGHWYEAESSPGLRRKFTRLGLWEACFDNYEHTSDYIGKSYRGCWWVFHKEYHYIRGWIRPSWFIGVEVLMTFALVSEFLILVLLNMSKRDDIAILKVTCVATFARMSFIGVSVIVFGVMIGVDRTWMPRFDMNRPSWSFGLAVMGGFSSAFCWMALCTHTLVCCYYRARDGAGRAAAPMYPKTMPMVAKA